MKPTLLAIIPAKQNSSRLPAKNFRLFNGKPLIVHTVECALQCKSIDRIIVSTDSPALQEIAITAGAEAPFLRPAELATAAATTEDVVLHTVNYLKIRENRIFDFLVVLQPTSPLRIPDDIEQAFQILLTADADSVVSVCASPIPASHLVVTEKDFVKPLKDYPAVFQELSFLKLNGAVYLSRMKVLLKENRLLGARIVPYFMPESRSFDIDTAEDLYLASVVKQGRKDQ